MSADLVSGVVLTCRALAAALQEAAESLTSREMSAQDGKDTITSALDELQTVIGNALNSVVPGSSLPGEQRTPTAYGPTQQAILRLPALHSTAGMTASAIAHAIGRREANVHTTMRVLRHHRLVEIIDTGRPRRWRASASVRLTPDCFARALAFVGPDEWTTTGDLSLAVAGDLSAVPTITRALADDPQAFEHSDRVRPDVRDRATTACRSGDQFSPGADHRRVPWDELSRRMDGDAQA